MAEAYNPDVLSCLANLSNDEVFTPPAVVNKMLDLLPQELFESPTTTFLDPAAKSGVFLREIAKRLIKGLEREIPDLQKRVDHILHNQVFGIATTELTSLVSRRTLYCSKYPNCRYSVSPFDTVEGNIRFRALRHTFVKGRCRWCGASESQFDRDESLESHAYEFIHTSKPEEIFNMKFDVIIGNPPYHMADGSGGSTDAAIPIYHRFVEKAFLLNPKYAILIVPSKWMVGGRGLQAFRHKMMNDTHLRLIFDFEDSSECFNGLHIDGGVNFFLWDGNSEGPIEYIYKPKKGEPFRTIRYLKEASSDIVIRDYRRQSIIDKVNVEKNSFKKIVSARKPFGVNTDLFNCPERYPEYELKEKSYAGSVLIWGVKGLKGGAKRVAGHIRRNSVSKNIAWADKYKLLISKAYSTDAIEPPKLIEADQGVICTETFLVIGPFESKMEQQNCLSYTRTNFFKVLLYFGRGTMQVSQDVFRFIPLQDFSKSWTDEELYKKYNLTKDEIAFIESMIKPME